MTNNTVKGTKKSAFTGSTTIPNGSYFDFVVNGQNLHIKDTDFYAALAVTGSIVQEGDPNGTPMLDKQGSVNAIRNITAGFGISSTINPYNGITLSTSSTFDETGATLVDDISVSSPVWRSIVAGSGVTATGATGTITLASDITADIATQAQSFDKSSVKASSPELISNDVRVQNYSVFNSTGVVSSALAAGASLNINTLLLESGETAIGITPAYKTIADAAQATFTDETNDKFLFPSNLHTYNNEYSSYVCRVSLTIDHGAVSTNQAINIYCSLKRQLDDSIVSQSLKVIHNHASETGKIMTFEFTTFVNTESDPYVVDGVYIDLTSDAQSSASFTLTNADIRIFKI